MKDNLITVTELEELIDRVSSCNIDGSKLELLDKLINSYKYYKELSVELELALDDYMTAYYGY